MSERVRYTMQTFADAGQVVEVNPKTGMLIPAEPDIQVRSTAGPRPPTRCMHDPKPWLRTWRMHWPKFDLSPCVRCFVLLVYVPKQHGSETIWEWQPLERMREQWLAATQGA